MRRTARTLRLSLIVAACAAGGALADAGPAAGGAGNATGIGAARALVEVAESESPAAEVRRFWTPDRMEAAVPVEGESTVAPSPALQSNPPFTRREITPTTTFPERTHGKVFFRMGGSNYVCSGTAVTGTNESVAISAGHCVHDEVDGWATTWEFVPGYYVGASGAVAPFGEFASAELASTPGWVDSGNFAYDVGAALVGRNGGGQTLQDALGGARGIAFDQPRDQEYDAFGYPAEPPFDGRKLWVCESTYAGDDPDPPPGGPAPMAIGCDMNGGSSGGGWIISGGRLNSVNSFGYKNVKDTMFGPYFGAAARTLYDGVCCRAPGSAPQPPAPQPPAPQPPPPEPSAPKPQNTYRVYTACGLGPGALPARQCRRRARKGAFFRSDLEDVAYRLCVRFPGGRRTCTGRRHAEAGALYVNHIGSTTPGRHTLAWWVGGERVGLRYLWVRRR